MKNPIILTIRYNHDHTGTFSLENLDTAIWARLKLEIRSKQINHTISGNSITLSWTEALGVIRSLGSKSIQKDLGFRFTPEGQAANKINSFVGEIKQLQKLRSPDLYTISAREIITELKAIGFTRRELQPFQLRDLSYLLTLNNGANFSVPGAGKTTVTFALHLLTRKSDHQFIVVAPKSAFQAWVDIVNECMEEDAPDNGAEQFTKLTGKENENEKALNSNAKRFIISYDLAIRQQQILKLHLVTKPTHLVLDESHRMKAGLQSQRGTFFLRIADCPVRRDILTGTPMPQSVSDLESQFDFLWPGHGYGLEILRGKPPSEVIGNLYVRTTKKELNLPKVNHHFQDVSMNPGQLALYSIIRNEFLRNFSNSSSKLKRGSSEFLKARRSVMRLLQLSVNPTLALSRMNLDELEIESGIIDLVIEEGHSNKIREVMEHAYLLAAQGKKCVIWTIFTDTIHSVVSSIADLNPVFIHGGVSSGSDNDLESREGRIRRFHDDNDCFVLVANPAAAGEGINLHRVCHNAIYIDRSYVSTHYLQSIDRIHRLGLSPDKETNTYIYRTKAPSNIGSIDLSVSRRLTKKIRQMQKLLDDPDLHQIAFDEEEALEPIDYDVEINDLIDLIKELEGNGNDSSFS
ncbi:MAG: DEAD/DEAH box helicase [Rhodobacteraceae bacterium]|nr:DEAD/DEAH box helicase [Paracoccaceae bacterium]